MNNRGITKENLMRIFPPALTRDKSIMALAEADAEVLAARLAEIDRARVIANIDQLDEAVLDILAYDFKVDWWDANYSVEEKRRTLKDSWRVHKILGTKAAVVRAVSAIYPDAKVEEWFEYGGEPYRFRIAINTAGEPVDSAKRGRVLERVNFYKSLRSHMDEIRIVSTPMSTTAHYAGAFGAYSRTVLPEWRMDQSFNKTVNIAGVFAVRSRTGLPPAE